MSASVFGGFDPSGSPDASFFERKRWQSFVAALLLVGGSLGGAFYVASLEPEEPAEEVIVEAEIQNFEMDEELDEEPEPEPEPPPPEPPPPSDKPVKTTSKPTVQPDIQNPDSADQNPDEREVNTEGPGYGEGGGGNSQTPTKPDPKPEVKPEPKPEVKPEPKPKKPKGFAYDPDKPIERPPEATVPKLIDGNLPVYPTELKSRNITGKVKIRLTIYKDGTVKGAKVLAKDNSVNKDEEPDLYEKANKLMLKAVAAAVQTWKFKPSTVDGKPISVFYTQTIPFTLN
jgi:periplasmic protein TonB